MTNKWKQTDFQKLIQYSILPVRTIYLQKWTGHKNYVPFIKIILHQYKKEKGGGQIIQLTASLLWEKRYIGEKITKITHKQDKNTQ